MIRSFALVLIALLVCGSPVTIAHAATSVTGTNTGDKSVMGTSNTGTTLINPLGSGIKDVPSLVRAILDFVIYAGSIIVVFMLIYVGFKFVVARGKEAELREARAALLWTVIGALILLGARVIADAIEATVRALGS